MILVSSGTGPMDGQCGSSIIIIIIIIAAVEITAASYLSGIMKDVWVKESR